MSMIIEIKKTKKEELKIKEPSLYNVILYNDNVTTFAFVIAILMKVYKKNQEEALFLTQKINNEGRAVVAQYTFEIASIKKQLTDNISEKNKFPLVCDLEQSHN